MFMYAVLETYNAWTISQTHDGPDWKQKTTRDSINYQFVPWKTQF